MKMFAVMATVTTVVTDTSFSQLARHKLLYSADESTRYTQPEKTLSMKGYMFWTLT